MTSIDPCTLEEIHDEGCGCQEEWVYAGSAYGSHDDSYNTEGPYYCVLCGADGGASSYATQLTHMDRVSTTGTLSISGVFLAESTSGSRIFRAESRLGVTHMGPRPDSYRQPAGPGPAG